MIKTCLIFLVCAVVCIGGGFADGPEPEEPTVEKKGIEALEKKCKNKFIGSPILYYTPETRLAYGGVGTYLFRLAGCDKKTRPSTVSTVIIYTQEKQFRGLLKTRLYFKNNDYYLESEIKMEKFPNKFFGTGCCTLQENEELYTAESGNFFLSFYKRINRGLNLGLQYHYSKWEVTETEPGGQLASGLVPGAEDGVLSGVSIFANRDTRDNVYSPGRGELCELNFRIYPKFLGSTNKSTTLTLDLRKYFPLFSSHVFAVQALLKNQTGTVPFMHLAQMGGQYNMRGFFEGRYRDKSLMMIQAEYRLPLFWRLGAVAFIGLGNVAGKITQMDFGETKAAYGFGLRYLFAKKEKLQIRMDIGFGGGDTRFYFSVFEAF
jgi:outer membrane protein assembly factor BamA